jgi:hypothetical protein
VTKSLNLHFMRCIDDPHHATFTAAQCMFSSVLHFREGVSTAGQQTTKSLMRIKIFPNDTGIMNTDGNSGIIRKFSFLVLLILTVLNSHKHLISKIIDLFFVSSFRRRSESRWIQETGFSGCRIKSGMTENFGLSS